MRPWPKFLLIWLPLSLVAVGLVCEALAFGLSYVPLNRHRIDQLAAAVATDPHDYPVVLIGDSVTSKVTTQYRIGRPGVVADISTHGTAGLLSELLLLKRYLTAGHRPRYLVLATSPDFLTNPPLAAEFNYWLYSVFRNPDERSMLRSLYPEAVPPWRPAAMSLTTSVFEPLVSLFGRRGQRLEVPHLVPSAAPTLETNLTSDRGFVDYATRARYRFALTRQQRAALTGLCDLSRQYGFTISLVWAPVEPDLLKIWHADGFWKATNTAVADALRSCPTVPAYDTNAVARFPYFDKVSLHVRGEGWRQLYATLLSRHVDRLAAGPVTSAVAPSSTH